MMVVVTIHQREAVEARLDPGKKLDDRRTAQLAPRGATVFAFQRVDLK
jgi:hypothetical protein